MSPESTCPHGRRALPVGRDARTGPPVERVGEGVRIRSAEGVRAVLRARGATTQAGFTSEAIPTGFFRRHPILLSDGAEHDRARRELARFFAPDVVRTRWAPLIASRADTAIRRAPAGDLDAGTLALEYSVDVAREIVGLTETPLPALARRLTGFQRQPPVDLLAPGWGRSRRQWMLAAYHGVVPLVRFFVRDVRPAIRRRRRHPGEDIISHLLADGARPGDILVECVTYATAGMITTREFMVMALWHLLEDDSLRERYEGASEEERLGILREIIRLDPVVAHLYRRVRTPLDLPDGAPSLQPGDLADLCIRDANADPAAAGPRGDALCPVRERSGVVGPAGFSFGAGEHRCPGEHLALAETDALLQRLLARSPALVRAPRVAWDDVVAGYRLDGMRVRLRA